MKKRLMIILAAVLVAGLVPVAAAAKPPAPPGPPPAPTLEACVFAADGITLAYTGSSEEADPGYWCLWTPDPTVANWLITVAPHDVASSIVLAVKYEHPGLPCVLANPRGKITAPVTAIAEMTAGGNCGADPDGQFVLTVDATVRKGNTVLVTVVEQ